METINTLCKALWTCIKGLGKAFWLIVKAAWEIISDLTDFVATVFDCALDLFAKGIAKIIVFLLPDPKEPIPPKVPEPIVKLAGQIAAEAEANGDVIPLNLFVAVDKRNGQLIKNKDGQEMSFAKKIADSRISANQRTKGYAVLG